MRSGTSGTGKSGVLGRWWNRGRNRGRAAEAGLLINAGQFVIIFDGRASQLDLLVCNPVAYSGFRLLVPSHAAGQKPLS